MRRREFIGSLVIAGTTGLLPSGRSFAADAPPPAAELKATCVSDAGRDVLQREINAVPVAVCASYLRDEAAGRAACAKYPALERLDATLPHVMEEARTALVEDKPAVWLVYNMGVVVKTHESLFTIDLCHPRARQYAKEFDFAVITHNHLDHYTQKFYNEMNGRLHKTVVSNFLDNYGAFFHKGVGGFSRGERTYKFKDVVVRTCLSDHNEYLTGFTMPVEIDCGGFTIFHVGDTANVTELHPLHTPDLWIHHCRCWKRETGPGAAHLRPKLTVVAHLHEMQHPCGRARWTFADGDAAKEESEKAGVPAVVPFWGDRIA